MHPEPIDYEIRVGDAVKQGKNWRFVPEDRTDNRMGVAKTPPSRQKIYLCTFMHESDWRFFHA
jgi:hypothetical protein